MIASAKTPVWLDLVVYSCPIIIGVLFLYGAVVRGHKLNAPVITRVVFGVIGAVLMYFAVNGLVGAFTR